jgi:hypothetical protein
VGSMLFSNFRSGCQDLHTTFLGGPTVPSAVVQHRFDDGRDRSRLLRITAVMLQQSQTIGVQLGKQRPGPQEVGRVKALTKPTVNRREHVESFLTFALGPKAGSSEAGAQFKGLRALIGCNFDRVLEGRVSFSSGFLGRVKQQYFAAFQLKRGVTPGLLVPLCNLVRLGQQLELPALQWMPASKPR